MASNKNQHFVPRCYLRPFTLDANGLAISLINIDRKKLITYAPVKHQCSRDYFYGTDEKLESAIQLIESGYGRALADLLQNNSFLSDANKTIFKTFWLFQHLRTESAAIRAVQMTESANQIAGLPPGEFSIEIKEAVQLACRAFADSMHLIDDLKFCLIKNKTDVPFVTSDNPAVMTNKWHLECKRLLWQSFGIGSAGIIAILPLTPKLLFIGYDGDVYSLPNQNGIVEIRNRRDAIALNRHQFLQCTANIYLHNVTYANELIKHLEEIESQRPKQRHIIHYAQLDGKSGAYARYAVIPTEKRDHKKEAIMHSQVIHPNPIMWPSQIKTRKSGAVYNNGTGLGYVRYSSTGNSSKPFWRENP